MGTTYLNMRQLVLLLVSMLVVAEPSMASFPLADKWHIHVVNGLNKGVLFVHCKSKDDDLGYHHLIDRGDEFAWTFRVNFSGTTLFWCFLHKLNANVSFEAFWVEKEHTWLNYRCADGVCIWTAKDDGIYLKNIPDNVDELIHKWGSSV